MPLNDCFQNVPAFESMSIVAAATTGVSANLNEISFALSSNWMSNERFCIELLNHSHSDVRLNWSDDAAGCRQCRAHIRFVFTMVLNIIQQRHGNLGECNNKYDTIDWVEHTAINHVIVQCYIHIHSERGLKMIWLFHNSNSCMLMSCAWTFCVCARGMSTHRTHIRVSKRMNLNWI